jgi:hypothetical protein
MAGKCRRRAKARVSQSMGGDVEVAVEALRARLMQELGGPDPATDPIGFVERLKADVARVVDLPDELLDEEP